MKVEGKNVVVTGKVAGESRDTAERKLREAGAKVQGAVGATTDLLIVGSAVGKTKTQAAAKHGVTVVPWEEVALAGKPAVRSEAVARKATAAPPVAAVREVGPMKCKAGEVPLGPGWQYEIKWDGVRCIASIKGEAVAMQSNSGKTDLGERYPFIAASLAACPIDVVLDGEIVVLDQAGRSSFQALVGKNRVGVEQFIVFDLLEADGEDARGLPLSHRREILETVFSHPSLKASPLVGIAPVFEDGEALLESAVTLGLEGLVSKRLTSSYREGKRSTDWVKTKVRNEQEFVVVGYTKGLGSRSSSAGAFLLAVNDDEGELVYCGSAGTGGTIEDFKEIVGQLSKVDAAQVKHGLSRARQRDVTWVKPEVVLQVQFQRWTEDGKLWHPAITGQRDDKAVHEVRRERSASERKLRSV